MNMAAMTLTSSPTLQDLLQDFADAPALPVADIASDSRALTPGAVFFACRGATSHALRFLDEGIASTLAAIVWDGDTDVAPPAGVPAFVVADLKSKLPVVANRFFADPSVAMRVAGITGTNGKTTVAWLLAQCWQQLGQRCAYIGTLGAGIHEISETRGLTTPDCIELQRLLARFREQHAVRAALEVSSHGLQQERVAGTTFDTAIFTNLSRDHIDYHGDMSAYGETKARLFTEFAPRNAIICIDSEFGRTLAQRVDKSAVLVASSANHDWHGRRYVYAIRVAATPQGALLEVRTSWGDGQIELPLVGMFNVANALNVFASLLADGVEFADALSLMAELKAPAGRMQPVLVPSRGAALPAVFVDYAHTPDALDAALTALRPHCRGKLWCVFGCGGDRDRGKRPLMGRAAVTKADCAVLTSDNPRSEEPAAIMRDVQ
ncbi:MAG: UDP-N-acetylmuramoyl-L-alanyl-D-glutamate--2,6-diaminopimelate ligase, partial [Woeseia sp.]|nr:UDP-N-acetylmuramoyl-L-alanyl-D-glutamate--2,6-diaminopimelate ligase [Woeseia sp.]